MHAMFYLLSFIPFLVNFKTENTCLSLQCSIGDTRFIPKECSEPYDKVCENLSKFWMQNH